MYRRMLIEILDLFHESLTHIQHAQNCPDCPVLPVTELKNRITYANDSFVAMAGSEICEGVDSVDSTLKAVNQARDYCDYLDAHVITPKMLSTWARHYRKAASCIDQIYDKLYAVYVKEYALF